MKSGAWSSPRRRFFGVALVVSWFAVALAYAEPVGRVAAVEGKAEIGRAGSWFEASEGTEVELGDTLRTGVPGRLRVVLRDESVLSLGDGTEIVVDEQVFRPAEGTLRTLLRLLSGKLRSLASEAYRGAEADFTVETRTAVVGVRGTDFVVLYDPVSDVTEVVALSGRVSVHSVFDRFAQGVFLGAREATVVPMGEIPAGPRTLEEDALRRYLEEFQVFESGRFERLPFEHGLVRAAEVPEPERASAAAVEGAPVEPSTEQDLRDVGTILDQPVTEEPPAPAPPPEQGGVRVRF
ncbi:MAG: hypothetical protein KatS3mg076_1391 [Candidatus Binatia bacterium]|nr:MAG: hypothetical protein KatS3mg076_1391 [Candidatus Binatia bacterium]